MSCHWKTVNFHLHYEGNVVFKHCGRCGCGCGCGMGAWATSRGNIYLAIKYASWVLLIFIINLKARRPSCKKAFNLIMLAINCRFIWPAWRVNAWNEASLIKCPPRHKVYAVAENKHTHTHTMGSRYVDEAHRYCAR